MPLLQPYLRPPLVSTAAWERLCAAAGLLPGDDLIVFELRLVPGQSRVDLALRLSDPERARPLLRSLPAPHLTRLGERWGRDLRHPRPLASLWLEFDLDRVPRSAPALPPPVVCARLDESPTGPVEPGWVAGDLLPALHGRPLTAAEEGLVLRALENLPAGARPLYAFSLLPRPAAPLRLELIGLSPAAMGSYLAGLGAPWAGRRLAPLLPLVAGADRYHLSFDFCDEVAPRIGVEYALARLPQHDGRWTELLDRLVAAGLCQPDKRAALLAWPGQDSLWTAAARWPRPALAAGGHGVRCLSHLKLVVRPEAPPEAKAYLVFQHLPGTVGEGAGGASRRRR